MDIIEQFRRFEKTGEEYRKAVELLIEKARLVAELHGWEAPTTREEAMEIAERIKNGTTEKRS